MLDPVHYLGVFASSLCYVCAKSFQQLHVVHGQIYRVVPTSFVLAVFEVFIIAAVVKDQSWATVLALGGGAGIGAVLAILCHKRHRS